MTTIKLLVLDDDKVDRLQLRRALQASGIRYELVEREESCSIVETVLHTRFDCIFLDYVLPGENGLQVVKKIREAGVKTPIVITTSRGNEAIAVKLMKAGASDYVIKSEINGQLVAQILRNVIRVYEAEEERAKAEKALKISESRLAEAQKIARIGNWECDMATGAIYWSQEMFHIYEVRQDYTPTIENYLDQIVEEDRPLVLTHSKEAFQGRPFNFDFRINTKSGVKYVNSQGYSLVGHDKKATKIIGTFQDITERKLAEQEISRAKELAENSMKVREIFLANISHEMRTPMNAVLGFTRLLYGTPLSAEQKGYIDAIHFSGESLLVIINDILDLAKIRSDKMQLESREFNLAELVSNVISVLTAKAAEKGLQLSYEIEPSVPTIIKGDPARLNQILINLIGNALKFTEKGGACLSVTAQPNEQGKWMIEFAIKDTGIGIPEDKQEAIFDKFVQVSSETTRKYGGTGLGLTIVKNLVELQGGTVQLMSKPGQGSTFTVRLPYEKLSQGKLLVTKELTKNEESFEALRDASILVAEDNGVNQILIRKVLGKAGCKIDIASNGREALEYLKCKSYDVVLMDVQMPEMDGEEATRYIRSQRNEPYANVPIIAMTAHAFDSDVKKCLQAGMDDHVSKPFEPEVLYAKISKYLTRDEVKVININSSQKKTIDLKPIYTLCNGDASFLNDLILIYDQQTSDFTEKLKGYLKSHNFEAIKSICHQIKSSYGIVNVNELQRALDEISRLLREENPEAQIGSVTNHINTIINVMDAITDDLKRNLKKTA